MPVTLPDPAALAEQDILNACSTLATEIRQTTDRDRAWELVNRLHEAAQWVLAVETRAHQQLEQIDRRTA